MKTITLIITLCAGILFYMSCSIKDGLTNPDGDTVTNYIYLSPTNNSVMLKTIELVPPYIPAPVITSVEYGEYWKISDSEITAGRVIHHMYFTTNNLWGDNFSGGGTAFIGNGFLLLPSYYTNTQKYLTNIITIYYKD